MYIKRIIEGIRKMYFRFCDDEVTALGAQLAYYFLLAFFPFLIFLMAIVAYSPVSDKDILEQLENFLPHVAFKLISDNISNVKLGRNGSLLSFGLITTLWAASNGVGSVIRALNKAYDEQEKRPFWKVKGMTILFTIALAIIIMLSFVLLIFGEHIGAYLTYLYELSPFFQDVWDTSRYSIMMIIAVLIFAALYRYLPSRRLKWIEVVPGSIFATLGWILVSIGFAYYVNNFVNYTKIYGNIGGVIALLIWLFFSAVIIILGGELNAMLAFDREGKEKPKGKRY